MMMEKNLSGSKILSESEIILYLENKQLRLQFEEIRYILNKRSNTEQLSLKASIEHVLNQRDKLLENNYSIKQELNKLKTILSSKRCGLEFLNNILNKFLK